MTTPSKGHEAPALPPQVLDAMKNLLEPMTPALKTGIESVMANLPSALIAPRTYEHNTKRDLESAFKDGFSNVDPDTFVRSLRDVLITSLPHLPDLLLHQCKLFSDAFLHRFSGSKEYLSLEKLVSDAQSKNQPECDAILKPGDQDALNRAQLTSSSLLYHALHSEGELRAEYAMHCTKRISERLYQPYLRRIHKLVRVSTGPTPPAGPSRHKKQKNPPNLDGMDYGAVLNELVTDGIHIKYPGLIDIDSVLLRNAEAHERWDYDPATDEVDVHDLNKSPRRFTVDIILEKAQYMYTVSGELFPKYVTYRSMKVWLDNSDKICEIWRKQLAGSHASVGDAIVTEQRNEKPESA